MGWYGLVAAMPIYVPLFHTSLMTPPPQGSWGQVDWNVVGDNGHQKKQQKNQITKKKKCFRPLHGCIAKQTRPAGTVGIDGDGEGANGEAKGSGGDGPPVGTNATNNKNLTIFFNVPINSYGASVAANVRTN